MLTRETQEAIEVIKRMDLKVAVPEKFQPVRYEVGTTSKEITTKYIHVPSLFTAYEIVIRELQNQVADIKRATRLLLDIKKGGRP